MADEGADVRHLVHHVEQAREERVRDVDAVGRFTDVEVFPGRNVLFEIEGIDMAERPGEFEEDDVASAAPRLGFGRGVGAQGRGESGRSEDAKATVTEKFAARGDEVFDLHRL